jgi:hypothetical protein
MVLRMKQRILIYKQQLRKCTHSVANRHVCSVIASRFSVRVRLLLMSSQQTGWASKKQQYEM